MSKVSDAKTDAGAGKWFKVDEDGYDVNTKIWGTAGSRYPSKLIKLANTMQDNLNTNCGKRTFKVPASLAPGNYLLRAEAIALHSAGSSGGAQ